MEIVERHNGLQMCWTPSSYTLRASLRGYVPPRQAVKSIFGMPGFFHWPATFKTMLHWLESSPKITFMLKEGDAGLSLLSAKHLRTATPSYYTTHLKQEGMGQFTYKETSTRLVAIYI